MRLRLVILCSWIAVLPLVFLVQPCFPQQTGSLQVAIQPAEVVQAGAQWRVDGGPWSTIGFVRRDLPPGSHTVEFMDIRGWTTPAAVRVNIVAGQTTQSSGEYRRQVGSLVVTLRPQEAVQDGARWRIDGGDGPWQASGATLSNLSPGYTYPVIFLSTPGWNGPDRVNATVTDGQTTQVTGEYRPGGSLVLTVQPREAVQAGAQWRVDGGPWNNFIIQRLTPGNHRIEFKEIAGWTRPAPTDVSILVGQTTQAAVTYTPVTGSLQVTIQPAEAVKAGAQWRANGGAWNPGGFVKRDLPPGSHTVEFMDITGWTKPTAVSVNIAAGQTTQLTGEYRRQVGSLVVTLRPQEAVQAGARWRIEARDVPWQASGATVSDLIPGTCQIQFFQPPGWTEPAALRVNIVAGQTTQSSGEYRRYSGSLVVTLRPQEAVQDGARWRIDGGDGPWQASGATLSNLSPGYTYPVIFLSTPGWNGPDRVNATVTDGQTTQVTGEYRPGGSLALTVQPREAVQAGAQWRVDGGPWNNFIVQRLTPGNHRIEFKEIAGWTRPALTDVSILVGQTTQAAGTYTPVTGSLQVTIQPAEAVKAGAQWRVGNGPWQASGATVSNLSSGNQTVEFKDVTGWTNPGKKNFTITSGQTIQGAGVYRK